MLIRAEDDRVLFGFWRGKRMRHLEPGLKGDGKYELGTLELREGDDIAEDHVPAPWSPRRCAWTPNWATRRADPPRLPDRDACRTMPESRQERST